MKTIIVPIAADKPEYDEIMPHVFRMNNNGVLLCIAGILGLDISDFDRIFFTILKKHSVHYQLRAMIDLQLRRLGLSDKAEVVELSQSTNSQPETIYKTIQIKQIHGSILVKDADCYFEAEAMLENSVCTYPLDSMRQVNPQCKSYVQTDDQYYITNIIEHRIIGRDFCAGGYFFEEVEDFLRYYYQNEQLSPLFMSHIVFSALLDGQSFRPVKVSRYKDWGTSDDWRSNE